MSKVNYTNDIPDTLDQSLHNYSAEIVAFNRCGTLCAVGTTDALIILYDVVTKSDTVQLIGHNNALISLCWTYNSRYIVSVDSTGLIIVWNIEQYSILYCIQLNDNITPNKIYVHPKDHTQFIVCTNTTEPLLFTILQPATTTTQQYINNNTVTHYNNQAILPTPTLCAVHEFKINPLFLAPDFGVTEYYKAKQATIDTDMNEATSITHSDSNNELSNHVDSETKPVEESKTNDIDIATETKRIKLSKSSGKKHTPKIHYNTTACYSKSGTHILIGTSYGWLSIYDTNTLTLLHYFAISPITAIKRQHMTTYNPMYITQLVLSYQGNKLAINTNAGSLRLFVNDTENAQYWHYIREYRDVVTNKRWTHVCFNNTGDHILATSANQDSYTVHIWSAGINTYDHGNLITTIPGKEPTQKPTDIAYHPTRALLIVPLDPSGTLNIYHKIYAQNWTSFAPNFEELPNNQEYIETETEFDYKQDTGNNDALYSDDIDIMYTVQNHDKTADEQLYNLPIVLTQDENVAKKYNDKIRKKQEQAAKQQQIDDHTNIDTTVMI